MRYRSLVGHPAQLQRRSRSPVKVVGMFTNTDSLLRLFTSVTQGQREPEARAAPSLPRMPGLGRQLAERSLRPPACSGIIQPAP